MYLNKIILCICKEGGYMVKNNIEVDVKVKCIETGKTQVQIAEEINTTSQYVNRVIKKKDGVINNTFVQMMEALGYDIELIYVKRDVNNAQSIITSFILSQEHTIQNPRLSDGVSHMDIWSIGMLYTDCEQK